MYKMRKREIERKREKFKSHNETSLKRRWQSNEAETSL